MDMFAKTFAATLLALAPVAANASDPASAGAATAPPQTQYGSRDSGYVLYRTGYRHILEERWSEAKRALDEMIRRFPRSEYLDDARFWSAYSLKHTAPAQALDAYRRFIKEFPSSNYFDDAVAEYERLGGTPLPAPQSPPGGLPEVAIRMAELEKQLALMRRRFSPPPPPQIRVTRSPKAEIRLKVETLHALSRSPEDPKAFDALKEAALSPSQPIEIRATALEGARRFLLPDVGDFLLQFAREGDDLQLRMLALDGLRFAHMNAGPTPDSLVRSIARDTREAPLLRSTALQVLQSRGDAELPNLLLQIAREDPAKDLQIVALVALARNPKPDRPACARLFQSVARDPARDGRVREAAIYGLHEVEGGRAWPFLVEIARSDRDERMREVAILSLGAASRRDAPPAVEALRDLASDRDLPSRVRQAALAQVVGVEREPDLAFLERLASEEPEEEVQQMALQALSRESKRTRGSFDLLARLYRSLPPDRLRSRETLLYSIAAIGTEASVELLADAARHEHPALRQRAIFYLGNIGSEPARRALLGLLRDQE
jgi:hypothetical protein